MIKINNFLFENNQRNIIKYTHSFFFGSILVLCLPPYNFWPFIFPSLVFLFSKSYISKSLKESFFIGWFFGLPYFALGLYWIFNSFLIRSDIFIYLIPFCLIILSSFLALFTGFVSFLNYKFKQKIIISIIFFSIFWTLFEVLRGYVFTGFPWNLLAHTWVEFSSLIQICSILGVYGLSFLTILFVLSLSIFFIKRNFLQKEEKIFFISIFILFFGVVIFGEVRLKSIQENVDDSTIYRIVQPNINQRDKLDPNKIESTFKKIFDLSFVNKMESLKASEKLIILWPETAITDLDYISSLPIYKKIRTTLKNEEYIISGTFRKENSKKNLYYNSIIVLDNNLSITFIYDKIHLVPFGEYTPFEKYLNKFGFKFFSLQKGNNAQGSINFNNIPQFKPLICYEIIFPGKYSNSDNKTIFLLNLTNDAWFGNTTGPYQHFVHSVFRAIEEGKHIIRVANTGISASIDPLGRIISKIDFNTKGTFDTKIIVGKKNDELLRTVYSKFGNKIIIFILLSLFCFLSFLRFRIKNNFS